MTKINTFRIRRVRNAADLFVRTGWMLFDQIGVSDQTTQLSSKPHLNVAKS